jgi:glycosyltransferase involved in cell wall biosynthesis
MEFSVIIPALNEEKCIENCINSVLNQTYPRDRYEIIVSDGASKDKTAKIAKKYADKVVVSKKRGIWWGRNYGAKFAKGKYLVFIDADTIIDRDYLKTVHPYLERGYVGVSTGFRFSERNLRIRLIEGYLTLFWKIASATGFKQLLGFSLCIPKKTFKEVGGFKDFYMEDAMINRDLKKFGKIKYISEKKVTTSPRKYEKQGFILASLRYNKCEIVDILRSRSKLLHKKLSSEKYLEIR